MFDKFSKLSAKIIWIIAGGLVLAVTGAYIGLIYIPTMEEINAKKAELASLTEEITKSKKIANKLEPLKEEVEQLNKKFKLALVQLPESKEIPELLSQISNIGTGNGLEFLNFQPQKEHPQDFYAEVPVFIKVKGRFYDILTFFDKVSKLTRIVTIANLHMGKVETRDETFLVTAEALATTFTFLESKESDQTKSTDKSSDKSKEKAK